MVIASKGVTGTSVAVADLTGKLLNKLDAGAGGLKGAESTKPTSGGKPDTMLPESELSSNKPSGLNETTPIKDQFGKGQNTSNLQEHLSTGGPSIPKTGVSGAHSDAAFKIEFNSIGAVEVAAPKTLAPGITEYTYNTPERIATGKTPLTKTTYDATYTDAKILEMSKQASSQVWTEIQKTRIIPKDRVVNVVIEGVPFRVLISVDPKTNVVTAIYSHPGKK